MKIRKGNENADPYLQAKMPKLEQIFLLFLCLLNIRRSQIPEADMRNICSMESGNLNSQIHDIAMPVKPEPNKSWTRAEIV